MKILVPKTSVPLWGKILGFLCMSLASLLFIAINIYVSIAMFVFLNSITWLAIKLAVNSEIWKKSTLEKDSFFKQSNFTLASFSQYSLLAVSSSIIRIVNINSIVQVREIGQSNRRLVSFRPYDISEVYKNYPRQGIDLSLNGKNVYYFDLPILEIKSVQPLLNKDVNELDLSISGSLSNSIFGFRVTTKQDIIYDFDTSFSKEFCDEINSLLS
jgi:hypothetical protein